MAVERLMLLTYSAYAKDDEETLLRAADIGRWPA